MNTYNNQAAKFLANTNTTITVEFKKHDFHFSGEKERRDIYIVKIKRGSRSFSFDFGQSIRNSGEYVAEELYYVEKLCGKFCLTIEEFKKLGWNDRMYFVKNKNFEIPSNHDILACLTKYDPCAFEDFCEEYGYDVDSKKAEKTYKSVVKEYDNVCKIWNDSEIELLQEIQ